MGSQKQKYVSAGVEGGGETEIGNHSFPSLTNSSIYPLILGEVQTNKQKIWKRQHEKLKVL